MNPLHKLVFIFGLSIWLILPICLGQRWMSDQTLVPDDPSIESQDHIGEAIAMTDDYLLLGAPYHHYDSTGQDREFNSGAVYVYQKSHSGEWELHQKLVSRDRKSVAFFGLEIVMSEEWIAIASPFAKVDTGSILNQAGLVELYRLDASGYWQHDTTLQAPRPAAIAKFGIAMSLSGNRLLIGAYSEQHDANGENFASAAGAAYIYEHQTGSGWTCIQKLVASDRRKNAWFGLGLSLDGDVAVIGAPGMDIENPFSNFEAGQAYIFERNFSTGLWEEIQILQDQTISSYQQYGMYPDISGDYLMIGNPQEGDFPHGELQNHTGSVDVYRRQSSGQWELVQTLYASDYFWKDRFGTICLKDHVLAVGAIDEDHMGLDQDSVPGAGSVYLFELQATGQWIQTNKITAPVRNRVDHFGFVLDMNQEELLIGTPFADHDSLMYDAGKAFTFQREWPLSVGEIRRGLAPIHLGSNPSTDLSLINQSGQTLQIQLLLMNMQGQQVIQKTVPIVDSWTQDFPLLPSGIYLVKWTHPVHGQHVQKWMKIDGQ